MDDSCRRKLYVRKSDTIKGEKSLGVFAGEDIVKGQCVERVPTLKIESCPNDCLPNPLSDYVFASDDDKFSIVAFGYGSLYNHSKDHNVEYYQDTNDDRYFKFVAAKDIKKDDEIFINYGDGHSVNYLQSNENN